MEKLPVNVEALIPAMNEFTRKIQSFDPAVIVSKNGIRDMLSSVEKFKSSFETACSLNNSQCNNSHKNEIDAIFSEFHGNVSCSLNVFDGANIILCCKNLVLSLLERLEKRISCILILTFYFDICMKCVNVLCSTDISNNVTNMLNYQMLLKSFLCIIKTLKKYWFVITEQEQKYSIILCLKQSYKSFCLMGKVIHSGLRHLIIFLSDRLKQCINKISILIVNPEDECNDSEFIKLMDSCLNIVDQLSNEVTLQECTNKSADQTLSCLKGLLDELLCHAMTVNHISDTGSDHNLIKLYSQKVLDEFENMINHENASDLASSSIQLRDVLCHLEEAVNTAILNVILDIFTDVNGPLRKLMDNCTSGNKKLNKSATDLENDISNFDEYMDKIVHIGLFAVSCSTDINKILEIRSCLASLESLEPELIMSATSLYVNPNPVTILTFRFMVNNWLEEIKRLKFLMDLVLDPVAFCRVVEKRVASLLYDLKDNNSIMISDIESNLDKILCYTKKLIKTLTNSMQDEEEGVRNKLKELLESLQLAFQECKASQSLLRQNMPVKEILNRIVKRIGLVITSINSIIQNLANNRDISLGIEGDRNDFSSLIERCGKIDECKIYRLNAISHELSNSIETDVLTPYINKGILRTKERTVLYNTPKHAQNFQNTPLKIQSDYKWQGTSRRRISFCRTLSHTLESQNSLDLELTAVLENLTQVNDTFEDIRPVSHSQNELNDPEVKQDLVSESEDSKMGTTGDEKDVSGVPGRGELLPSLNESPTRRSMSNYKETNPKFDIPEWLI